MSTSDRGCASILNFVRRTRFKRKNATSLITKDFRFCASLTLKRWIHFTISSCIVSEIQKRNYLILEKGFNLVISFHSQGTAENPGINPRALQLLFSDLQERVDWNYSISMSLLEIYNESIRDLLGSNPVNSLEIKQGKEGVHVPGLEEVEVENVEDVHRVRLLN